MFNDANGLMHLRTTGAGASNNNLHNISFDNLQSNVATVPTSWMGFNSNLKSVVMKDDFNTNPQPGNVNSKLYVEAQTNAGVTNHWYAIFARNINAPPSGYAYQYGIWAEATGLRTPGSTRNYGGYFRGLGASGSGSYNYGLFATASGTDASIENYAGYFEVNGSGAAVSYGIRSNQ